jgi:chromosome segregation ATPase
MSLTNDPTLTEKEANIDLARVISQGFARIETEIGAVKAEIGAVKAEIGTIKTELNDVKLELGTVKTKLVHVETEIVQIKADIKVIGAEIDKRASIIETKIDAQATKIDAQAKEVSILQQRVNSSEADRSRIITGLISAALGAILALGISKLFSFEPQRNPTNRSAIEYIPEDRIVRSSMVSFNPYASNQII